MQYLWPHANEKRQLHAQKDAENDEDTTHQGRSQNLKFGGQLYC